MKARTRQLINRLRSAQGHMAAITRMIDRGEPCDEILHQVWAVRGAMRAVDQELWNSYLHDTKCGLYSKEPGIRAKAWREIEELMRKR